MHTLSHPNVMSLTGVCLDAADGLAVIMPYMSRGSPPLPPEGERKAGASH